MVCTTVEGSSLPLEVAQHEPFNPLRVGRRGQAKRMKFREPASWIVGLLPQTFAEPTVAPGDVAQMFSQPIGNYLVNDGCPLEVIDVGRGIPRRPGDVYLVKILGAIAEVAVASGELGWKLITVGIEHKLAKILEDLRDINEALPGLVEDIQDWLRRRFVTPGSYTLTSIS